MRGGGSAQGAVANQAQLRNIALCSQLQEVHRCEGEGGEGAGCGCQLGPTAQHCTVQPTAGGAQV